MTILDSDILIDYARGLDRSQEFIESIIKSEAVHISVITAIEIIKGASDKKSQQVASKLISNFKILPITKNIGSKAYKLIRQYHLAHTLGMADSLIAATALNYKALLLTRNLKHFDFIISLKVHAPY